MPPELKPAAEQPDVWQSIEQWMDSDRFRTMMRDEFPEDAAEWLDPVSRRKFLTLMGASAALAGAVGCNPSLKPASPRKVVPYVEQPAEVLPGVPLYFATAMPLTGGVATGLLVKSVEGRPIKIEGNPNHPDSLGSTNLFHQASVLGLYDPDRSAEVLNNGSSSTIDRAIQAIQTELNKDASKPAGERGAGVRIVTEPTTSPTIIRLMKEFTDRYPKAKWVQYEPVNRSNARRAAEAAFGKPVNPVYRLDRARVVLALDSDFLSAAGGGEVRAARDFMAKRKVRTHAAGLRAGDGVRAEQMNRLYAVESMLSNTGATADHRLPVKPSEVELFARSLAAKLGVAGVTAPSELPDLAKKWIDPLVEDLTANKGAVAVIAGDGQSPAVHLLVHAINQALGAFGNTVVFTDPLDTAPSDLTGEFLKLVKEMAAGSVTLLLLAGGNPVYDAPIDVDFLKALDATRLKGTVVHHGLYADETASHCSWHINATHYLETWGDVRAFDGTASIQQPLIAPICGGRSLIELLAALLGPKSNDPAEIVASDPLDVVKATWVGRFKDKAGTEFEDLWNKIVRDGVVPGTGLAYGPDGAVTTGATTVAQVRLDALSDAAFTGTPLTGGMQVIFRADPTILDGRFSNLGWLQELPKPITKLTWDNAAIVSPKTALEWGCERDFGWTGGEHGRMIADVVELTLNGRKVEAGVFILPGHADGCVTLHLGYGRDQRAGRVGKGAGFNAYALRTTTGLNQASGLSARKTGKQMHLACTQGQYYMEGRRPVRSATVEQFKTNPEFAQVAAASAAEYKEIRALTPGTEEDFRRLGLDHPYHTHRDESEEGEGAHGHGDHHDSRLIPLSLYPKYPQEVTPPASQDAAQASVAYRRWGMAIDLGACTGCTACVAACVAENNIPVVGKEEVTRGRAMHWIRIDRYFAIPGPKVLEDTLGDRATAQNFLRGNHERAEQVQRSAAIETHFQPVLCQQCEKAPCEIVCPVAATAHSADGLNDMVYNRCVGTRYCSNNCPYKVRRFNFLQYTDYTTESLKLVNNPDVTVRQRGVMEKCTYCVQRIRNAEIQAEREWTTRDRDRNNRPKIRDGEVVTACQAACPTGAILFGDLNDFAGGHAHTGAAVLRWKVEPHNYGLLAEVNTMPRTSYLAAIRNPNPKMPRGA